MIVEPCTRGWQAAEILSELRAMSRLAAAQPQPQRDWPRALFQRRQHIASRTSRPACALPAAPTRRSSLELRRALEKRDVSLMDALETKRRSSVLNSARPFRRVARQCERPARPLEVCIDHTNVRKIARHHAPSVDMTLKWAAATRTLRSTSVLRQLIVDDCEGELLAGVLGVHRRSGQTIDCHA